MLKTLLARATPTVIMLMDFPFRGFDELRKIHHDIRYRARLLLQPRDGNSLSFARPLKQHPTMLAPSLTGWRAQYDRMRRSYERVTGPYTSSVEYDDALHHFAQDCWHLKDWIMNDPAIAIGKAIEGHVEAYRSLRIVADLAIASKHLTRTRTNRVGANVTSTSVTVHLCQNRPADISYVISLADGTSTSADAVVRQAVIDWDALLERLGLLP